MDEPRQVGDARLMSEAGTECWGLLARFSAVCKARWLAAELAAERRVPRCDLESCADDTDAASAPPPPLPLHHPSHTH
jgi:hypothetical protein